jgi:hypothetical protein
MSERLASDTSRASRDGKEFIVSDGELSNGAKIGESSRVRERICMDAKELDAIAKRIRSNALSKP